MAPCAQHILRRSRAHAAAAPARPSPAARSAPGASQRGAGERRWHPNRRADPSFQWRCLGLGAPALHRPAGGAARRARTALILPPYSVASSSMSGAIMRHGPHLRPAAAVSCCAGTRASKTRVSNAPGRPEVNQHGHGALQDLKGGGRERSARARGVSRQNVCNIVSSAVCARPRPAAPRSAAAAGGARASASKVASVTAMAACGGQASAGPMQSDAASRQGAGEARQPRRTHRWWTQRPPGARHAAQRRVARRDGNGQPANQPAPCSSTQRATRSTWCWTSCWSERSVAVAPPENRTRGGPLATSLQVSL